MTSPALFLARGDATWEPTDAARGPWAPDALHGGPVAALLAHAALPLVDGLQPVRMTVEIMRPVPVRPLTVTGSVVRPGRRVRAVEVSMAADGQQVASASVVAIRSAPVGAPDQPTIAPPPGPHTGHPGQFTSAGTYDAFHNTGVDHAFVAGDVGERGPATDWIRLRVPVVAGETPHALERVAAAADFGNGISRVVDFEELLFINPDLTIYLHRLPAGEWVCLDAVTRIEPNGIGLATSALHDEEGPIGTALQSLVVDARD